MNKKAFTLIEIVVSITIFSIVLIFLYQSLDISKKFNKTYSNHLDKYLSISYLEKLIYEDIFETTGSISIDEDKNKNTILKIKNSNNTFHYPFNSHITYLLSKENNILRIESNTKYEKDKIDMNFLNNENTYIDIVAKNIKKFLVLENKKNKNGFTIYLETIENKSYLFSAKTIIP